MAPKRKSVAFHQHVSLISPNNNNNNSSSSNLDGPSSPSPIISNPPAIISPLSQTLDPMYMNWLRSATKSHYPFIVKGTFATHVYRQNFEEHGKIKDSDQLERAQKREAAVPFLADKYGSLGWGSLYWEVSEKAWVKNYREIYRFNGSDEELLVKIAEAYNQIKQTIAAEESARTQSLLLPPNGNESFVPNGDNSAHSSTSTSTSPTTTTNQQWESFTQAGGVLMSPDFGPGGVDVTFGHDDNDDAAADDGASSSFDVSFLSNGNGNYTAGGGPSSFDAAFHDAVAGASSLNEADYAALRSTMMMMQRNREGEGQRSMLTDEGHVMRGGFVAKGKRGRPRVVR